MMSDRFVEQYKPAPADVAICGSMTYMDKMLDAARALELAGLSSHTPTIEEGVDWSSFSEAEALAQKKHYIDLHLANIAVSDCLLICNYEKDGELGYVGANTLMEMTAGYIYDKPIYMLEKPDTDLNSKTLEINALGAVYLAGGVDELITILSKEDNDV